MKKGLSLTVMILGAITACCAVATVVLGAVGFWQQRNNF